MNSLPQAVGYYSRSCCWLLLAVFGLTPWVGANEPIYSKDHTFYIPYTVASQPNGLPPDQVELYVSGDNGTNWERYAAQPPGQDHRFAFRAGIDGEFWFAVRTIGSDGSLDKPEINAAELVVIVDQQAPTIELNTSTDATGQVTLDWKVRDKALKAEPLRIEYRQGASGVWQSVAANVPQADAIEAELQGTASWSVGNSSESIAIRAVAEDKAGNTTVMERNVAAPQQALAQPSNDIPWPHNQLSEGQFEHGPNANPAENGWRRSAPQNGQQQLTGLLPPPNNPVGNMLPPISSDGFQRQNNRQPGSMNASPAMGRNERVSQSQRFQLEYEIEGVDSIAVHRVEIWASHDNGQTWRHLGDDEDKQSPYLVTVPNDGVFGFRLLVQAQEGLPVRPPLSGDLPDVWVRVDSTVPSVRLTNARYGRGAELGQLIVTWNATDDDLTQSPVTLLFGESSNGPWRIAAEDLPNTGAYSWGVDDRIPSELFLRVEVQDRAGNIGSDTLSNPIRADGLLPKGKIRNVRPASHVEPAWPTPTAAPPQPLAYPQPTAPTQSPSFTQRMRDRLRF